MRGFIPFEVLLVGEAPGESEDVLGWPFVGPSGKLLDHILDNSVYTSYLIANTVVCTPPREDGKIRDPFQTEKETCSGHIRELISKFSPKMVIAIGLHAHRSLEWTKHIYIIRPAVLLRYPERKADIAVQQTINQISRAMKSTKQTR